MKSRIRSLTLVVAILGWVASSSFAGQTYLITDLGNLGGGSASAAAINESNQVVGTSSVAAGVFDAFLFSGGAMRDLGNFGGGSTATALNDRGDVVGSSFATTNHPFLFRNGTLIDLGLPSGFNSGVANGVNDSDQVIGEFTSGTRRRTVRTAFLWQNGAFQIISGSNFTASAINDAGQVAGTDGGGVAAVWHNGVVTELGALPGATFSSASAINELGQVAGSSFTTNSSPHAALFENGEVIDLGVPAGFATSTANALNDSGVVVGSASVGRNVVHAFIAGNGIITDLNRLIPGNSGSWILQTASGINNAGNIVGTGTTNGIQHAFLLTPTTAVTVPAVPIDLASVSSNGVVSLSWAGSVGATSYNVKRGASSSGPFSTIASVTTTGFTDHAVVDCQIYFYVVSAVNSAGESPNSANVAGDPQSVPVAPRQSHSPSQYPSQPVHRQRDYSGLAEQRCQLLRVNHRGALDRRREFHSRVQRGPEPGHHRRWFPECRHQIFLSCPLPKHRRRIGSLERRQRHCASIVVGTVRRNS